MSKCEQETDSHHSLQDNCSTWTGWLLHCSCGPNPAQSNSTWLSSHKVALKSIYKFVYPNNSNTPTFPQ